MTEQQVDVGNTASRASQLTFMFTDVAGSTDLFRQFPDEMFAAMAAHDEVVNQVVRSHGGDPFKHTGDGVVAVFDDPRSAVRAAVDIQRRMPGMRFGPVEELVLRIGLHTGPARQRDRDYFGPALATASRLEGAANGRQILVSEATSRHFADLPDDDISFTDLGVHRFKGVEPIRVFQVNAADLAADFGPIAGKRETPEGNIPANLSSFIGRQPELVELEEIANASRITTILGPGGIGKTRLAIELARILEDRFTDGAWMVDLSLVESGFPVWPAFTAALGLSPVPDGDPRSQALDALRDANALVLIDNCEHVISDIADAIVELGAAATHLSFITTSRHVLGVPGEAIYEVPPLGEQHQRETNPAVELFLERGRLADRRFQPDDDDLETIAALCSELDHLPLAIEIAAAHLRRLSLDQIRAQAADPLDFRATGNRRTYGKQRSLRETLEWSYALLEPSHRTALDQLSVFSGSFTEDIALAVCTTDDLVGDDVLAAFDELLDASLINRDSSDTSRFRMLRTVRSFGNDRLAAAGTLHAAERRHGEVYAALVAEHAIRFDSIDEGAAALTILADLPDLRAAFERAVDSDLQLAADLTAPLFLFNYIYRGADCGGWPARILARPGADELPDAPILLAAAAGHALHSLGDPDSARAYITRAENLEESGATPSRGWVAGVAGQIAFWSGDFQASIERHRLAIDQSHALQNHSCEVISISLAAFASLRVGDLAAADELLDSAEAAYEAASQPSAIGYIHFSRGCVEMRRNPRLAHAELEKSLSWAAMVGNEQGANRVRRVIGDLLAAGAEPADALRIHARALLDFPERGDTIHAWSTIESMIRPLAALGRDDDVAFISGAVAASPITPDPATLRVVAKSRDRLGAVDFDQRAAEGAECGLHQIRRYVEASFVGSFDGAG